MTGGAMINVSDRDAVVAHTQAWVESVVVKHNFCPFARREVESQRLRYQVVEQPLPAVGLQALADECALLDREAGIETTLLVCPRGYEAFEDFLDLVDLANQLLEQLGYEGVYQLAHFHPDYQFEGVDKADASNYTNRSPYPMLHLIREASMAKALASYEAPEQIPERNVALARSLGATAMQEALDACRRRRPG